MNEINTNYGTLYTHIILYACTLLTLPPLTHAHTQQTPSINTTNIDTLLVAADQQQAPPPPEELQDRIHFLFNNLSASNLSEKVPH